MITKDQYVEIIELTQRYIAMYEYAFPHKPMSDEFCAGMQKVLDLIQTLVKSK